MSRTVQHLKQSIMRRIYYAYAIETITHPAFTHGVLMAVCTAGLTRFVSFGHVFENMMNVRLGGLGTFVVNALMSTESWTLFILMVLGALTISLRMQVRGLPRMMAFAS